jgi:4-hydroxy-3-methylbut-2-enyl diphosphate reductase
VKALAACCEIVLVLGSEKSSNSKRLREVARQFGATSHLIRSASDLSADMFRAVESIGVTAAASTPEELVRELVGELRHRGWPDPVEIGGDEEPEDADGGIQ